MKTYLFEIFNRGLITNPMLWEYAVSDDEIVNMHYKSEYAEDSKRFPHNAFQQHGNANIFNNSQQFKKPS